MTKAIHRATCCCGRCVIELEGDPEINGVCHCRDCKKRTGSAFGWSCYFADAQLVRKTGDVRTYVIDGQNPQERWFCANCGSTLYWKAAFLPGRIGVAGGCFADDGIEAPSVTVSNDGRCHWVTLPGDWRTCL